MVTTAIEQYQRLDVLVYNSGAIWWSSVEKTPMKRFQLMQRVNPEGLYGSVQACLPHLYQNGEDGKGKGRIVVISPPIYRRFLRGKTAYAMGKVWILSVVLFPSLTSRKFGMSALTIGMAIDFEREERSNMAITSLWPAAVGTGPQQRAPPYLTNFRPSNRRPPKIRKPTDRSFASLQSSQTPSWRF